MAMLVCVLLSLYIGGGLCSGSSIQLANHIGNTSVNEDSVVVTTYSNAVYVLSAVDLSIQSSYQFSQSISGLATNQTHIILCFINTTCLAIHNGTIRQLSSSITYDDYSSLAISLNNDDGWIAIGASSLYINHDMSFREISNTSASHERYDTSLVSAFNPRFVSTFFNNEFIYHVIQDRNNVRVFRLCKNSGLLALYEIHIKSLPNFIDSSVLTDAQLITIEMTDILMLSLSMKDSTDAVYSIKLHDIDSKMDKKFEDCSGGSIHMNLPWIDQQNCGQFGLQSSVNSCNFQSIQSFINAIHSDIKGHTRLVFEFNETLTATLFISYQSYIYCYVALTHEESSMIKKYWLFTDTNGLIDSMQLLNTINTDESVNDIKFNSKHKTIYYTTSNTIHTIPLDDCNFHSSCDSCISSLNSLCGWCLLESTCSLQSNCDQQWLQETCPAIHIINTTAVSSDTINKVTVSINIQLPSNINYSCLAYNEHDKINSSGSFDYATNTCYIHPFPFFSNQSLDFFIILTSDLLSVPFVATNNTITVINCFNFISCSHCLSDVCQWSANDMKCKGSNSPVMNTFQVCPHLIATISYQIPLLATTNNVTLIGSNLPLPSEFNGDYICHAEGSNIQSVTATYINSTHIICPFHSFQNFHQFEQTIIVHVTGSDNYTLEVYNNNMFTNKGVNVSIYNCSVIDSSCIACTDKTISMDVQCIWYNGTCSPLDGHSHDLIISNAFDCPAPILNSIYPDTGPTTGGTLVSLYSNEPNVFSDIVSIRVGPAQCRFINSSFTAAGFNVMCETGASSTVGSQDVILIINKNGYNITFNSSSISFTYHEPSLYSVVPQRGPIAGGTHIRVFGSFLNIGQISRTRLTVAGINCLDMNISQSSITCKTQPSTSVINGSVAVFIDNAIVTSSNVVFHYLPNPVCSHISPNSTIVAGGITVSFIGNRMSLVSTPLLVINFDNNIYTINCSVISDISIQCLTPGLFTISTWRLPVKYELRLDNVICKPDDLFTSPLALSLKPNPIFSRVEDKSSKITLHGTYLTNVPASEINVTFGDQPCIIQSVTEKFLDCIPPPLKDGTTKQIYNIFVTIGNGSLVYSLGQLERNNLPNTSGNNSSNLILSVSLVSGFLVLAIAILIISPILVKCWKIRHPPLKNLNNLTVQRASTRSSTSRVRVALDASLQSNLYCDIIDKLGDNPDNIYEEIPANAFIGVARENNQYENDDGQYDILNRNVHINMPVQTSKYPPTSLAISSNETDYARPTSEVIQSSENNQLQVRTKSIGGMSLSSPDLTYPSLLSSTTNLISEDETDSVAKQVSLGVPEYAKIIKKLTPIQEDYLYTRVEQNERPRLLNLPQDKYISMHSATDSMTSPLMANTNYVVMKSAATTPQERPDSSYVVMRSTSISSETTSLSSFNMKRARLLSSNNEEVPEDVFKSGDYIEMNPANN
jgi:hypothetical protein